MSEQNANQNVIDDRTANYDLPLPNVRNMMPTDCQRIRQALQGADSALKKLDEAITGEAEARQEAIKGCLSKAGGELTGQLLLAEPTDTGARSCQAAPVFFVRDQLRAQIEAQSGGRNTIVRDEKDNPHVMVVMPRFNLQDIDASLGNGVHPAFIVNGITKSEILIGKYPASRGSGDWAQTLPGKFPWVHINFDTALAKCRALGAGFGLATRAINAARALWLWKEFGGSTATHEYMGNTQWGRSHSKQWQTGVMGVTGFAPGDTGNNDNTVGAATKTGSGPVDWHDDASPFGRADFVGNVWEWEAGIRTMDGEIQIIRNNDALMPETDMTANAADWQGILASDGSLAAPGTTGTLKYENVTACVNTTWKNDGAQRLCTTITNRSKGGYSYAMLKDTAAVAGLTPPPLARTLGLVPLAANASVQGGLWTCNLGERLALAGGDWNNNSYCGPFALNLPNNRTYTNRNVGFRAAFYS